MYIKIQNVQLVSYTLYCIRDVEEIVASGRPLILCIPVYCTDILFTPHRGFQQERKKSTKVSL